jgi:rubredoxin
MTAWMCQNCGYTYREEKGEPRSGIPPGTAWEDVPVDWHCPDCDAPKAEFEALDS